MALSLPHTFAFSCLPHGFWPLTWVLLIIKALKGDVWVLNVFVVNFCIAHWRHLYMESLPTLWWSKPICSAMWQTIGYFKSTQQDLWAWLTRLVHYLVQYFSEPYQLQPLDEPECPPHYVCNGPNSECAGKMYMPLCVLVSLINPCALTYLVN